MTRKTFIPLAQLRRRTLQALRRLALQEVQLQAQLLALDRRRARLQRVMGGIDRVHPSLVQALKESIVAKVKRTKKKRR